jgi:hypothetical protein
MSFGTFLLYLFLSLVVINIGYVVVIWVSGMTGRAVLDGSDSLKESKNRRAMAKWERVEASLEDDDQ